MPKQTPEFPLPGIRLDTAASLPLHRQLYEQLGSAIRSGHLKPGTRLPSTRALAHALGVSRTTTLEAYRDLHAEGYLEAQVGAGTVVVQNLPELFHQTGTRNAPLENPHRPNNPDDQESNSLQDPPLSMSKEGMRFNVMDFPLLSTTSELRPFRIGTPALDAIPQHAWARAVRRAVRYASTTQLDYQHPAGYRPLREEITTYLAGARGVNCSADQVIIVAGIQAGLSLVAHVLIDTNDAVWIEDPGYFKAKAMFHAAGAALVPVPVDREGLIVAEGRRRNFHAKLAYVTPSHQFPLGVTMSYTRRGELLQWAKQANAWIIEDDYDSEYQYNGRPIPALHGLDENERVIYLGTFSKVFFPALRLGYIVAPSSLVNAFTIAQHVMGLQPPTLEQAAMAAFMSNGEFTRHIRRMRSLYAERRDCLLANARQHLGDMLHFERKPPGLHLVGWLPENADEHKLAMLANQQGITVYPLSEFWIEPDKRRGLVFGFAAFNEKEIKAGIQKLADVWKKLHLLSVSKSTNS